MSAPIDVVVNTHGFCFDGAASAAAFTAMLTRTRSDALSFSYRSCGYGPKMSQVPAAWLSGSINAILDFRYTEHPALTFYFDHHKTGFGSPEERLAAERQVLGTGRRLYFDPAYGSCTKLVADVARREYATDLADLAELVRWADIIDTAGFPSAESALAATPAQRIASVIEHHGDAGFLTSIVPILIERSLDEVAAHPIVTEREPAIVAARNDTERRIRASAQRRGDVVFVDLSDDVLAGSGKFVTYALYPDSVYSVMLLRTKQLIKLGVGYNPWCGRERRHDIAEICKREGGGGHAVVGAATFALSALGDAREAAARVVKSLEQ